MLFKTEDRALSEKPSPPSGVAEKARIVLETQRTAKILVVDDEPGVVLSLQAFLQKQGYQVITASNGAEAVEKFRQDRPQVVLLDILMPGKSGLQVLQEVKEYDKTVGVIIVTALEDEEVGRNALKMGAFDYILKPFDPEYLQRVLWWQLKLIS